MAEAPIDFRTQPDRYRHWKLALSPASPTSPWT